MKWTEAEDEFLSLHYDNNTVPELAWWLVNHSEDAIETRIKHLGLTKTSGKRQPDKRQWTHGEIRILKERMSDKNKNIAAALGRSTSSVRKMKDRLRKGLSFPVSDNDFEFVKGKGIRNYRKIVEQVIGRKLLTREHVHHIDVNKKNNHPNNLFVCNTPEIHGSIHAQLDNLLYTLVHELLEADVIKFTDGKYSLGSNHELIHLIATSRKEKKKEGASWNLSGC